MMRERITDKNCGYTPLDIHPWQEITRQNYSYSNPAVELLQTSAGGNSWAEVASRDVGVLVGPEALNQAQRNSGAMRSGDHRPTPLETVGSGRPAS